MDIFGHARAAKLFGENSKGGEFFPFVNGEGVSLILGRSIFYLPPPPFQKRAHFGKLMFSQKGGGGGSEAVFRDKRSHQHS